MAVRLLLNNRPPMGSQVGAWLNMSRVLSIEQLVFGIP